MVPTTADTPTDGEIPTIAAFTVCFAAPEPSDQLSDSPSSIPPLATITRGSTVNVFPFLLLFMLALTPLRVTSAGLDATGKEVTFYPDSLMLARNPRPLILYGDTTLVSIHVALKPLSLGPAPTLSTTCSPQQKLFFDQLLSSVRSIQRVIRRLSSLQGVTNLLECDLFLRRYYFYSTGLESQLTCTGHHFADSLQQCKSWAQSSCQTRSSQERAWLRTRQRRSAWACGAGIFGLAKWIWEKTGHSCENNNIAGLIATLAQMANTMTLSQRLVHLINGKTVYLIKTTDKLTSRVNTLSTALRTVDKTFHRWQQEFNAFGKTENCHYDATMEFLSHYTTQVNRAFSSLLRLLELEDFTRQASRISQRDLLGYNDLPQAISSELLAQLSTIPELQSTADALRAGYSLLIRPLLDYEFTPDHKFRLNVLFTVPQVPANNAFCTLESLTPLKYNLSGICFTGPLTREDLALVTCSDRRYFISLAALGKCYHNSETTICPNTLLSKASRSDLLGVSWTPSTKVTFQRYHRRASHCHN